MNVSENLISVLLITYNSADHLIEALESVKNQTYPHLELIISDDCSSDNTIEVCEQWLSQNKSRFYNTKIVQTKKNTGVSGNLNRGIKNSTGKWIKPLAGDDYMYPHCIERFIAEINLNSDIKVIFL
jgi:glycosyltransferase involved in cell wall biosynthesis